MRKLGRAKELAQRGDDRADIDQRHRRELFLVADRHALFDDALHTTQTDAQFVLDQLTHRLDAAIAQMIDIIGRLNAVVDLDHAAQQADYVVLCDSSMRDGDIQIKFLIQFVAADALEVIVPLVEQLLLEELAGVVESRGIAGAHLAEELDQGRFGNRLLAGHFPFRLLLQGGSDEQALGIVIHVLEQRQDLLIRASLERGVFDAVVHSGQRAQEDRDRHRALAVELQDDVIRFAGLEFHPGAAVGDQLGHGQGTSRGAIGGRFKVDARGTDQLRDNDALRSVNNERAFVGHLGEVPEKDILLDRLGHIGTRQQHRDIKRAGISEVTFHTFFDGMLRLAKPIL